MMIPITLKVFFAALLVLVESTPTKDCTITRFSQVQTVINSCTDILVSNLTVPAGIVLELDLQNGTTMTFEGTTLFEHTPWSGPLIRVKGVDVTLQGAPGSVFDGQGPLYWDHLGDKGPKKPQFMKVEVFGKSVFRWIKLLNCPHHCVYIGKSDGLTIANWTIDNSAGDLHNFSGHNTDGFDVSAANNLIIENTAVLNQDDCIAIRYGSNILVRNMYCSGGHGLSLSVGFNKTSYPENVVENVLIENSRLVRSANGIHVKTHTDGYLGLIRNVTYRNIKMQGVTNYGINVQQDYRDGGSTGTPKANVLIDGLNMINITGSAHKGSKAMGVYIICGDNSCTNWNWGGISIDGARRNDSCNFSPTGYECHDV
uniref:endo-polygalacturonase n=1 Tax=Phaedon cochleariae TaxID=80249 RepID=K7DW98_PHACE|nr:glycoside hydrolase family 28 protein [Phaedon cochleariae]